MELSAFEMISGEGARQGSVRAGLSTVESTRSRLFRTGIPRELDGNEVLAGLGEIAQPPGRIFPRRSHVEVLREILRARPGATGRRVHQVLVLLASEARFGHRQSSVQRQHGSAYGKLHRARYTSD